MLRKSLEIWLAALSCLIIGAGYALLVLLTRQVPAAGGLAGHLLGLVGFVLMLATEVLYSLRKRTRSGSWGSMALWLKIHIYTGIVGPFMVLLHTSWKAGGLAGVTLALTGLIVASGFIGRFLYTRIPRTAEGIEDSNLIGQIQVTALASTRRLFSLWHTIHIPIGMALFTMAFVHILGAIYYATLLR